MNWQTLLAIDFDRWAAETYRANFPGVRVECGPVADFIDTLPDADVVIGGPPCQDFSFAGKRELHNGSRDCIPYFVESVGFVRPRQFLMENVAGLLAGDSYPYFCAVIRAFEAIGYIVDYRVLDAVNFGVPQFRSRVWVWGMRKDVFDAFSSRSCDVQNDSRKDRRGEADIRGRRIDRESSERDERDITDEPSTTIAGTHIGTHKGAQNPRVVLYRWSDAMLQKHPPASPAPTVQAKWFKGGAEGLLRWKQTPDGLWVPSLDAASIDCVFTDPPSSKCTLLLDGHLKIDHRIPVGDSSPSVSALHRTPVPDSLLPYGEVQAFLGSKREAIQERDKFYRFGFAVNRPDNARMTGPGPANVLFQITDFAQCDNSIDDRPVVGANLERETTGVITAGLGFVDAKASFSVDKTSQPVSECLCHVLSYQDWRVL